MAKLPNKFLEELNPNQAQVSELLDQKLKADYLGGPSVRGWSKISTYMICKRMYFLESVRKLKPRKSALALELGTLFHACMAAHYATGGQKTYEPLHAVKDEKPEIAAEVARLLHAYFTKYAAQEAETWDIRGVEYEIVGEMFHKMPWMTAEHAAKVSGRFDLVARVKPAGAPNHPFGPCPDGVYVIDHKVHARITKDLTEGYGMDGQFLLMAYLWRQQKFDLVFGPLNGFIINIITKTKEIECKRLEVTIDDTDVNAYVKTLAPVVVELDSKINAPDKHEEDSWARNYAACKSPKGYGPCKFWDYCISHGKNESLYQIAMPNPTPSAK